MNNLTIDERSVDPISINSYQELIQLELANEVLTTVFPYKENTPRYAISTNNCFVGHYKVLSMKPLANQTTSLLTLHKQ